MASHKRASSAVPRVFPPVCIVVCGPSGVGKTTIGKKLAERLCIAYEEGDDYHSGANIHKMSQGIPLDDEDRIPWLVRLRDEVISTYRRKGCTVVLACSALKKSYRDILRGKSERLEASDGGVQHATSLLPSLLSSSNVLFFVMLTGSVDVVARGLAVRKNHFMPPSLLHSQFSILEPLQLGSDDRTHEGAEVGMVVDMDRFFDTDAVVDAIVKEIQKNYSIANSSSDSVAKKGML